MEVDRPSAVCDRILEMSLRDQVILIQHVQALESPALPLPGDASDPFQGQIGRLRESPGILDVVPGTMDELKKLHLDGLRIMHGIQLTSIFEPPIVTSPLVRVDRVVFRNEPYILPGKVRQDIFDRMVMSFRVEQDGMPKQFPEILRGCESFRELGGILGAHTIGHSGLKGYDSVPGRIAIQRGREKITGVILRVVRPYPADMAGILLFHLVNHGVEQEPDVLLSAHLVQQQGVEINRIPKSVPVQVFDQQLSDHTAFPGPSVVVPHMGGGAQYPEPYLA